MTLSAARFNLLLSKINIALARFLLMSKVSRFSSAIAPHFITGKAIDRGQMELQWKCICRQSDKEKISMHDAMCAIFSSNRGQPEPMEEQPIIQSNQGNAPIDLLISAAQNGVELCEDIFEEDRRMEDY